MPLNRAVYGECKEILDIIAGPAFVCDCSGENFGSLSEEQMEKYQKQFAARSSFSESMEKSRPYPLILKTKIMKGNEG